MQNKMFRFLTSLGIADPSIFDMDFELVGRDSANPKKVVMAIRKETAWEMSLLEEFQESLSSVKYDYSLRFSYSQTPSFESVDQLFEDWYLSHYHGIPSFQLTPGDGNQILTYVPEGLSPEAMKPIIDDFNALLKWLSYPENVVLADGEAPIQPVVADKIPAKSQQIQENVVSSPVPETSEEVTNESASEESEAAGDDEKEEAEDSCSSESKESEDDAASGDDGVPPIDEDEVARQAAIAQAEQNYMAEQKAATEAAANARVFRRGDYQPENSIEALFSLPQGNVEFSGNIYATNFRVGRKGGLYGTIGVGDATSAINVRAIESRNGMNAEFLNALKAGDVVKDPRRYRIR
jgi:hypothetical protein